MSRRDANNYVDEMQTLIRLKVDLPKLGESFALLDFPNIKNVGDSAIWLGEIRFFRDWHGIQPSYVSAMSDYDPAELKKAVPDGPIYLHGGGNFGDIWSGHQKFREKIIDSWMDRKIIQLPQSLHFSSVDGIERAAEVINKHPDFTLLVRDEQSQKLATEHFSCKVKLCPDMAFAIGPVEPTTKPLMPILAMLRDDKEQIAGVARDALGDIPVADWITEPTFPVKMAKLAGSIRGALQISGNSIRLEKYNAAASQRFARGLYQLSRAELIVTDRLHVHIISILLGRSHGVLDNSYGKIANFRAAFPEPAGLTQIFENLADAADWACAETNGWPGSMKHDARMDPVV